MLSGSRRSTSSWNAVENTGGPPSIGPVVHLPCDLPEQPMLCGQQERIALEGDRSALCPVRNFWPSRSLGELDGDGEGTVFFQAQLSDITGVAHVLIGFPERGEPLWTVSHHDQGHRYL